MNTVFRKSELLAELDELKGRLKDLQSSRVDTLRAYQKQNNVQDKDLEVEDIQLKIENLTWKIDSLF